MQPCHVQKTPCPGFHSHIQNKHHLQSHSKSIFSESLIRVLPRAQSSKKYKQRAQPILLLPPNTERMAVTLAIVVFYSHSVQKYSPLSRTRAGKGRSECRIECALKIEFLNCLQLGSAGDGELSNRSVADIIINMYFNGSSNSSLDG
jgi:hypothetical protein